MAATDFLHDERAARPAIFTLVVGAHLAALFIPLVEKLEPTDDFPRLSRVFLISAVPRERPLSPTLERAPLAKIPVDSFELAQPDLPRESAPSGSAMTLPDWKQSGADAAADAARDNYRALGPAPEEPKVKLPPPPFSPAPRHKFGEMDEDGLRNPILWLGNNCFLRPENYMAQPGDPLATVPMTFCTFSIGKKKARGDLFDHLRKKPPVP